MLLPLLCSAALAHGGGPMAKVHPASGLHVAAIVTDPLSHGTLGDNLLSLNEAIRLHNGTLLLTQMSLAEQSTISLIPGTGTATYLAWIDIDGSSTPVITIERDLDPIVDTAWGLLVRGINDAPVFDFSGPLVTHGLRVPANSVSFQEITLFGGPYGIDVVQTDVAGQAGATLRGVRFENQATFGLRVTASVPNAIGRVILEDCSFVNTPTGILFDESPAGRTTIFEARNVHMTGTAAGLDLVLGPGGTGRYTLDRLTIHGTGTGLRLQRPNGADRTALVESTFVEVRAVDCASIAAAATGVTWATLRMWDLRTVGNGTALVLGGLGQNLYGVLEDSLLEGAVSVLAGGGPAPLEVRNLTCRSGAVSFGTTPAQPMPVADVLFSACAVQTTGSAPIPFTNCCFLGSQLAGTSNAPAVCVGSFAQAAGAHVQQNGALPAAQLGSLRVTPDVIGLGSNVTLQAELPPGLFGVFVLGLTDPTPSLLPAPLHVYTEPAFTFTLPGIYRAQQSHVWSIPNSPVYAGMDFTALMAVLPDPGMQAPWLHLPPGRRFGLR